MQSSEAVSTKLRRIAENARRMKATALTSLSQVRETMMQMWRGWLIEVDIQSFFDTLDHGRLREILGRRVRDGVILRQIGKWLNAGVLEAGELSYPDQGTPQGGVISPLLANIYLHEVLDRWMEEEVKPRARGNVVLVRYADDFVILCRSEQDARELYARLPERFAAYNLTLHPEKTRLLPFDQPPRQGPKEHMSFDFLGFTHLWMKNRRGIWVVFQITSRKRLTRSLEAIRAWLRQHLHAPVKAQHRGLCAKLLGHYAYFGRPGNARALKSYHDEVRREWRRFLSRRSHHGRIFWDRYRKLLEHYPLPTAHLGPPPTHPAANSST